MTQAVALSQVFLMFAFFSAIGYLIGLTTAALFAIPVVGIALGIVWAVSMSLLFSEVAKAIDEDVADKFCRE